MTVPEDLLDAALATLPDGAGLLRGEAQVALAVALPAHRKRLADEIEDAAANRTMTNAEMGALANLVTNLGDDPQELALACGAVYARYYARIIRGGA